MKRRPDQLWPWRAQAAHFSKTAFGDELARNVCNRIEVTADCTGTAETALACVNRGRWQLSRELSNSVESRARNPWAWLEFTVVFYSIWERSIWQGLDHLAKPADYVMIP
jgi:hypothetical protein